MLAGLVGICRNSSAVTQGMKLEEGRKDLGIERHVVGAMAELAAARILDLNWNPVTGMADTGRGDLKGAQVKSVTERERCLIVRKHDPAEHNYVLVLVSMKEAEILGWFRGVDAKVEEFWTENKGHQSGFWVPREKLRPVDELLRLLHGGVKA